MSEQQEFWESNETPELLRLDPRVLYMSAAVAPSDRFTANIKRLGVLVPVAVRRNTETGTHTVTHGRRRTLAAIRAGLTEIPCLVYSGPAGAVDSVRMLAEQHHADPNRIAEMLAVLDLLNQEKTVAQIAQATDLSRPTIERMAAYSVLEQPFIDAAIQGKVALGTLDKIVKLNARQRDGLVSVLYENDGLTGEDVRRAKMVQNQEGAQAIFAGLGEQLQAPSREQELEADLRRILELARANAPDALYSIVPIAERALGLVANGN